MRNLPLVKTALALFIISLFVLVIILAKNILVPLAFSLLLSYLIYPIVFRLERWGIHRIPAILIVIITFIIVVGAVALFFSIQIANIQIDVDAVKNKILQGNGSIGLGLEKFFGVDTEMINGYAERMIQDLVSAITSGSAKIFTTTSTIVFQIFILPVFTFFILFYRTKTAFFIFKLTGEKSKKKTIKILREVSRVTSRYLGGLFGVVLILAVLNTLGLTIIGVPHALVLGVGAALLNLIPYFGTLLGALIPLIYVLISTPDPWSLALKVAIMFIIVQFLENNIITPNVVGNNVKINALTIIIGLLLGNLVWGIAGMLIIIPYIAILKIIMRNIESLQPFAYLLSSKGLEKHQIHYGRYFMILKEKLKKYGKLYSSKQN